MPGERDRLVLVIDDDDALRDALAELLEAEGFVVETASNGREALERLHDGPSPRVIVVDLLMPVMDGWSFCEAKARDPELRGIPVVIVSATGEPTRPPADVRAGEFFRKPADVPRLLSTLEGYCPA